MTDPLEAPEDEPTTILRAPAQAPSPTVVEPPLEAQYRAAASAFRGGYFKPVLGPSLVSFGVMLWAYVVFGDLVLAFGFPEGFAILALLGSFGVTAYTSGRQSVALLPPPPGNEARRLASPGLAGFGLTVLTVLIVSAFAHASRVSSDSPVTLFLLAVGFATATYGYHSSGPNLNPPSGMLKAGLIAARVLGALLTIIVIARALVTWR